MNRILRLHDCVLPNGTILVEYDARHPKKLARDETTLPAEERVIADAYQSMPRRIGFTAGRIALHAALAESTHAACAMCAVLRDERGRPLPSWLNAPAVSIAHTRVRAIAAVAPDNSCAAIGIDVEEIDEARAHALVRMSLSVEECDRVRAVDPTLLAGPIAVWCARESCVKAYGFEVGWFGTALVATAFEETQPRVPDAERAWNISITFEARAAMHAHAWQSRGAMFAAVTRLTEPDASPHAPPHT